MTVETKVFSLLKELANNDMRLQIASLKRKLSKMEQQRNAWRESALRYQKNLIERTKQ